MKIRRGFVSNSSSSSFIILLPDNFNIDSIDFEQEIKKDKYCDSTPESVKNTLETLIKDGAVWDEEYYQDTGILRDILRPYAIAVIDVSSDSGQIVLADRKKIMKILNES